MATISDLLYASPIPSLSTILDDLNIITTVPCDDLEKMIHECHDNNTVNACNVTNRHKNMINWWHVNENVAIPNKLQYADAADRYRNIINGHNVKGIVVILDKLQCVSAVTMLLKSHVVPEPDLNIACTATINHSLHYNRLRDTYARTNSYNALYNYDNTIHPKKNHMHRAIQNGLHVTTMTIPSKCTVTDDDIRCCTSLTELIIDGNTKITTLAPFAKTLHILSLRARRWNCSIDDNALSSCTDLEELNISYNYRITTCAPFAKSLKILYANMYVSNNSDTMIDKKNRGMTDDGLASCTNIEILHARDNINITTCAPFAKSLKILDADGVHCGITDDGLSSCDAIRELCATDNAKITTCAPFAQSLVKLDASNYGTKDASVKCGISDTGLSSCSMIRELNARGNPKITTCVPFAKSLKILRASRDCGISDTGLSNCTAIEKLYVQDNLKITTCEPFAKTLIVLNAFGNSGIDDKGLSRCASITDLDASGNSKITTCDPFARSLRVLTVSETNGYDDSGIGDAGLKMCRSIEDLDADYNTKITTCDPFARTLRFLNAVGTCGICNDGLRLCNSLTEVFALHNTKIDVARIATYNKNMRRT